MCFILKMLKTKQEFYKEILKNFPHKPTNKQNELLDVFTTFIFDDNTDALFLLKWYAGTGKTTVISTVVTSLWKASKKAVLLAPT